MSGKPLRMAVRLSFSEGDEIYQTITRCKREGDRDADVLRRTLLRYNQILINSAMPAADGVLAMSQLLLRDGFDLLFQPEYPKRIDVNNVVEKSAISEDGRRKLIHWLDKMSYADFARLIEAVENYYNGR